MTFLVLICEDYHDEQDVYKLLHQLLSHYLNVGHRIYFLPFQGTRVMLKFGLAYKNVLSLQHSVNISAVHFWIHRASPPVQMNLNVPLTVCTK